MKKGQIQMGESIAITIIIIIFIILGLVFYSRMKGEQITASAQEYDELDAVQMAQVASKLPELKCTTGSIEELSCFDLGKVRAFSNETFQEENRLSYIRLFGDGMLILHEAYPTYKNWTLYESEAEAGYTPVRIPVVLYEPVQRTKALGVLEVISYAR